MLVYRVHATAEEGSRLGDVVPGHHLGCAGWYQDDGGGEHRQLTVEASAGRRYIRGSICTRDRLESRTGRLKTAEP